jgi:hypothetical protein
MQAARAKSKETLEKNEEHEETRNCDFKKENTQRSL